MPKQQFTFLSAEEDAENPNHMNLIFADLEGYELAAGENSRPFDALTSGTFRPMFGGKVEITDEDLATITKNTKRLMRSTKGESGELAGLPIDTQWHNHDGEAGWMVGVSLEDGMVRVTPQWTDIGLHLLETKRRKFFSASVDREDMVIFGGTLTNYPATRDGNKKILLRPIELSQPAGKTPLNELFFSADDPEGTDVNSSEKAAKDKETQQMNREEMLALLQQHQETVNASLDNRFAALAAQFVPQASAGSTTEGNEGDEGEGKTFEEIVAMLQMDTEQFDGTVIEAIEGAMQAQYAELAKRAEQSYLAKLGEINRKQRVTSFVTLLTSPSDDRTTGLSENPESLTAALLSLPKDQYEFWHNLLERAANGNSFVEFAERGHAKKQTGTTPLPAAVQKDLDEGTITIAELSNPILGLGELADYDLSKWQD